MSESGSEFGKEPPMSAVEAKSIAQNIAFAPIVFQASLALRDLGVLELLNGRNILLKRAATKLERNRLPGFEDDGFTVQSRYLRRGYRVGIELRGQEARDPVDMF